MMNMKKVFAWIGVCALLISALAVPVAADNDYTRYDAEDGSYQASALHLAGDSLTNFKDNPQAAATFTVRAANTGEQTLGIVYTSAGEGRLSVVVNETKIAEVELTEGANQTAQLQVPMNAGSNKIMVWNEFDTIHEDFTLHALMAAGSRYPAKNAKYLHGSMGFDASHPGFSGTGFIAGFYRNVYAHIQFTVTVEEDGVYDVTAGYANGLAEAQGQHAKLAVYVNGTKQTDTLLMPGQYWSTYLRKTEELELKKGTNTITYWYEDASVVAAPNFDYIEIAPRGTALDDSDGIPSPIRNMNEHNQTVVPFTVTPNKAVTMEAEEAKWYTADIYRAVSFTKDHSGYTGTGFVAGLWCNKGATVTFPVNVLASGTYTLTLRYANGGNPAPVGIYVGDTLVGKYDVFGSGGWPSWASFEVPVDLTVEDTSLSVVAEAGEGEFGINLDSVILTPLMVDAMEAEPVEIQQAPDYTPYIVIGLGLAAAFVILLATLIAVLIIKKSASRKN